MKSYFGWNNNDDILMTSSSGGIFTALAEYIFRQNGVVYGACVDQKSYEVQHIRAENSNELCCLRGSKYQQSSMMGVYSEIVHLLTENIMVLFSGTPCRVAALQNYLKIKKVPVNRLFCVEILCHGVTSTKVVREYIKSKEKQNHQKIRELSFRTKDRPWYYGSSMKLVYENGKKEVRDNLIDPFYIAYVNNLILRPSCYACPFAQKEERKGDIILGDFWGAEKLINDRRQLQKGVGLVLTNTESGEAVWRELIDSQAVKATESDLSAAIERNSALIRPSRKNKNRERFFSELGSMDFIKSTRLIYKKKWIKNRIKYLIGYNNIQRINAIKDKVRGK